MSLTEDFTEIYICEGVVSSFVNQGTWNRRANIWDGPGTRLGITLWYFLQYLWFTEDWKTGNVGVNWAKLQERKIQICHPSHPYCPPIHIPEYPDIWANWLGIRLLLSIHRDPVQYLEMAQEEHVLSYPYLEYEVLQESDEVSRPTPQKKMHKHNKYTSL